MHDFNFVRVPVRLRLRLRVPVRVHLRAPVRAPVRVRVRVRPILVATLGWLLMMPFFNGSAGAADLELDEYLQRATAAKIRGDWESAAGQYAQAINHADLPRDAATRSAMQLEYGRAMGTLCQFGEAEKYLLRAREMAAVAGASPFNALIELAALNGAQKKYAIAAEYFMQLMPTIEREARVKSSPQLVADALEKFAVVLAATGNNDEAELRRREAEKIRAAHPKPAPPGTITPYGTQCGKS